MGFDNTKALVDIFNAFVMIFLEIFQIGLFAMYAKLCMCPSSKYFVANLGLEIFVFVPI